MHGADKLIPCPVQNGLCMAEEAAQLALAQHTSEPSGAEIVTDPSAAIMKVAEHISSNPCEYVKTGQCAAAVFLVKAAFSKPV